MKKIYLILTLLAAIAMTASAQDAPTLMWANNFSYTYEGDANLANIGYNIAMAKDGNLFIFNDCGTTTADTEVLFGNDVVGMGTDYSNTSSNHNMFLVKADANTGKAMWSVYSNIGEGSSGQGRVVASNDGGAILVAKVRHTYGRANEKISFVDATGATTTLDWVLEGANANRYYNLAIIKIDTNGAIEWNRMIAIDNTPMPDATTYADNTSDAVAVGAAIVDNDGNLYIGGRFATSITFDNGMILTSQSSESWDGDPQKTRGDLFIAKFDSNGNYLKSLVQTGAATSAIINALVLNQGKIYFAGYVEGAGNELSLNGIQLAQGNGANYRDLLVGCMSRELDVEWAKALINDFQGNIYNKMALDVIGDNMWISGKVRTTLTDEEGNTCDVSAKTRDALLLRLNKSNGQWQGATNIGTNQSGFNGVFESKDDPEHVYAYGHTMLGNLFIQQYKIEDLSLGQQWALHNNSADIENACAVCDGNNLYTMARVFSGDVNVYYAESGTYTVSQNYGFNTLVCGFTLPVSINNGENDSETLTGDVNKDGNIDIADVTTLIDYILTGAGDISMTAADVNGDGDINISDVTALIDVILRG